MQSLVEIFADLSAAATYFTPSGEDRMTLNEGKSLFDMISLGNAEKLRDYDVNVGILPSMKNWMKSRKPATEPGDFLLLSPFRTTSA